jgi:hypothetical protein
MEVSFIDAVSVEMGVIIFKSLGTIIPGQLGVEEYGNKVLLDVIGINSNEIWLIVSLVRRSRQLFWLAMAGVFLIIITKKSYKTDKCRKKYCVSHTNIRRLSGEWKLKVMS